MALSLRWFDAHRTVGRRRLATSVVPVLFKVAQDPRSTKQVVPEDKITVDKISVDVKVVDVDPVVVKVS